MAPTQKEKVKDGEQEGDTECDDMARATAACMGKREEEKGQAGAEVEEGRGTHWAALPPPPEAPLVPGSPSTLAP